MSDFGNHPGGGFSSVDGYNDLAGSQAEEQRRMQEDAMNRQLAEQQAHDAAMMQAEQQAAIEQQAGSPRRNEPQSRRSGKKSVSSGRSKSQRQSKKRVQTTPATPINPMFAIFGFLAAGFWGMGLLPGDGKIFAGVVTGLIGAYIAGHYYKVLVAATIVGAGWWFLSQPVQPKPVAPAFDVTEFDVLASGVAVPSVTASGGNQPLAAIPKQAIAKVDRTPFAASPSKQVTPTPAAIASVSNKPAILLRPHQPLKTDVTLMRKFQNAMFDFEKRTGKSFLTDHPSMKPATETRFDYFSRYEGGKLLDGQHRIKELNPTQNVWDYRQPQLWELDLMATIEQQFLYSTTSADGTVRDGKMRMYSGDGLCYQPMPRPLYRDGKKHTPFLVPVIGGQVWQDFVRAVYEAKSDEALLKLDPINLAIAQTHQDVAQAQANYDAQLKRNAKRQNSESMR
ncbi:hypothetical protein [Rhodopirellula sp. MGV]|uniref:hypothetical protein n=1 Tax=Rhodopirellula sp. MGV TaxID=2023130 RepID=UPI000B977CD2|nr:hypothetical protein [Rhodopirellula sp. MGV]OYP37953.1 hypothetical protein CGZ80_03775 [Rhodopirellula sp. MGV]PNY34255.1 hypothetical protein C2E31_23740 [Rhodopirellula baltica]